MTSWILSEEDDPQNWDAPTISGDFRIGFSSDNGLYMQQSTNEWVDDDDPKRVRLGEIFKAFAARTGSTVEFVSDENDFLAVALTPATTADGTAVLALARQMDALLSATQGGDVTPVACRDLVCGGHAELLIGQREAEWLDGKRTPYHLDSDSQKLELAKDAAGFANARDGGVLVLGAATTRELGGDRITEISPFPERLFDPVRYRSIIGDRVFQRSTVSRLKQSTPAMRDASGSCSFPRRARA